MKAIYLENIVRCQADVKRELAKIHIHKIEFSEDGWTARFSLFSEKYQLFFDDGIELQRRSGEQYITVYSPLEWGEPYFSIMLDMIRSRV
jgi:hypothetical protein